MSARLELARSYDEQSEEDWGCWRVPRVDTQADTIPAPAFILVSACQCGARWDHDGWNELHLVGLQEDGCGGHLELRNCICGSTIARGDGGDGRRSLAAEHRRDEGDDAIAEERAERVAAWRRGTH